MKEPKKKTFPVPQALSPIVKNQSRQRPSVGAEIQGSENPSLELQQTRQELKQTRAECRKLEKVLEQQRLILAAVIGNAGGPAFSVNRRYCYTSFNKQHAEVMKSLFGADIEVGKNLLEYHTNLADRLTAKMNIDRALRGETVIMESYAGNEALSRRHFEILHNPIRASNNKVVGVSILARDITEQKNIEGELARQNEKINEILTSIQDDFYVLDRDWNFVYANKQFTSKIGKETKDFLGKNIWEMFPKHIGTVLEENFRAAMEKRELRRFEIGGKYTEAWYSMRVFPTEEGITVLGTDISQPKRAEEELKESEKKYRELVKYAPVGIYEVNFRTHRFVSVNDVMCQLTGYTREELLDKDPLNILDPPSRSLFLERLQKWLAGEKPGETVEYRIIKKDGGELYAVLNVTFTRDENGVPKGATVIGYDITERKRMEDALRDSEAKANALIKYAPSNIYEIDNRGPRFISVNDTMCKILGYTREELFSLGPAALLDERSQVLFAQRMKKQLAGEPIDEMVEYRVRKKDGSFVDVVLHVSLNISSSEPYRVLVIADDITERKRAEQALHASEERFKAIASSTPDHILVQDRNLRYTFVVNPQMDLTEQAMLGKTDHDFLASEDAESLTRLKRQVMETGQAIHLEVPLHSPNGKTHFFNGSYVPRFDARGQVDGLIGYFKNVTELKQAEETLRRLNRTLRALSNTNQAMIRATDEKGYLEDVCRIIVEDCGHAMVWIGFKEQDEEKSVRPVASAGYEEGYLETLKVTWADTERGHGPTGTTIRTGRISHCRNMLTDPQFAPWRSEALQRGYASSIVLPLMDAQQAFGAITIYSRQPDSFSEEDENLLAELAGDLAYGIQAIRMRAAHAQAEAALHESEERYHALFSGMTEGFALHEIICDESGQPCDYRFLDINPAFERLTGLKRLDVVGKLHNEILPGDSPEWVKVYGKVAMTGEPVTFDNYSPALQRHYEVFAYQPVPRQFAVIFMDITERKRLEQELQNARQQAEQRANELDIIFNSIADTVLVYDRDGLIQRANQSAAGLFGFDPVGENYTAIIKMLSTRSMDGRPLDPEHMSAARALSGQISIDDRLIIKNPRGQDVFIIASAAPLWAEDQVTGAVAVWHDVSERERLLMQIEDQRQQAEVLAGVAEKNRAEIEAVLNALTDSIIVYGPDEIATRANAAARNLLGFDPTGVDLAKNMATAGTQGGPRASVTARALRGEPVTETEFDFTGPTGERRTVSASSIPMRDAQGHILGAVTVSRDITARKQAEETRAWLASFPERNPNPVVEAELNGQIRYANPAAQQLFPGLKEQAIRHAWLAEWDNVVSALATGQTNILYRDVTVGENSYQQAIFHDPQYGFIRIYGLDITGRKRAETEVQKARAELELRVKERTRQLAEANDELRLQTSGMQAAANGIVITDNQGSIQWCNPAFAKMTGYTCEEVIGWNPRFLKSGRHDRAFYEQMWQTLLNGQVWRGEMINRRKDTSLYHEEQVITPVRDGQNQITHFIAVKQDVSARKQAEEGLRLANAYNRSLIEASLDPLVTITPEGKIGDVNQATEKVTGYTRAELIGTDFHNYFSVPEKARLGYQKVFESGIVRDYDLEIRAKDGSTTPVLYNASIFRDEAGEVLGVFAVARDITDRKQFETQLVQAEKHAVIGRMVGSITHEINNPLQTIKNCLYLIQQDVTPGNPIQEPLEMAASETLRITNLVGQLRELYRPKAGSQKASHEVLDILEEAHALLIPHLNHAKVQWQSLTGLQRCYIDCVRDQILEVFLNISMNAIEAMQHHGGTLIVNMNVTEGQVAVIFRDTGPGIPNEMMEHLFEPFMTSKASGLGLGLSITYGIVQRHGGQILVDNQPGQGAAFTVLLPLQERVGGEEEIQHGNE